MPAPRLDVELAARGMAPSRERARSLVLAGRVRVDGRVVDKAGARVPPAACIEVTEDPVPYVSRGGAKLAAALDAFRLHPEGEAVLDVGASTGGFTDCLLQRGARLVIALDVGHGQIDWTLRNDPRIVVVEHFNARRLSPAALEEATGGRVAPPELKLAVVDVSFISLALILPALATLPALETVIGLIKPQFEVGRRDVGRGGIVRESRLHAAAVRQVLGAASACGWVPAGLYASPLAGAEGNREFFAWLVRGARACAALDAGALASAITMATGHIPGEAS